ncbi:MAG TPA: hypothetical protein VFC50_02255 [Candidatus Dormibacteraeota bacterium]|nr:hypothetical protein [Candidatus Dormibacteraeota bacterium]
MTISLKMNPSKRLYYLLAGLVGLLLAGLIGGAYGTNQLLTSQAVKVTSLKAKSLALSQEQLSLANAKKEVQTYSDLLKITQTIVPEDKDQAEAVREIVNIAASNDISGVSLQQINFPASTLGSSGTSTGSGAATTAPTSPSPKSANSSAGKLSQLVPVKNIPGVYDLLITIQSDPNKPIAYSSFVNFLSGLEHNRRTAQISTITLQPNANNPNLLSFTLTLNEYIKP